MFLRSSGLCAVLLQVSLVALCVIPKSCRIKISIFLVLCWALYFVGSVNRHIFDGQFFLRIAIAKILATVYGNFVTHIRIVNNAKMNEISH